MGCGLHCVIQKKEVDHRGNTEWVDLIKGALDFMSSDARTFNSESTMFREDGFPQDFKTNTNGEHNGYYMGEHSFGWFLASTLMEQVWHIPESRSVQQEIMENTVIITFNLKKEDDDEEYYYEEMMNNIQKSLRWLLGEYDLENIRFVIGYDS